MRCLLFLRWQYWRWGIPCVDYEGTAGAAWLAFLLLAIGCLHSHIAFIISAFSTVLRAVPCILAMIGQGGNNTIRSQWAIVCCIYWMMTCALLLRYSSSSACLSLRLLFACFPNPNASRSSIEMICNASASTLFRGTLHLTHA